MQKKPHELRELLIYFFNLEKSAAEAHRLFVERYGEAALSERSYREWFQKFKNGEFDIEDKGRSGTPKVYEDAELEALLDQNSCQNFNDDGAVKSHLIQFTADKDQKSYERGIMKLPGRWQKVIKQNEKYIID